MIYEENQHYLLIGNQSRLIRCAEILLEKGQAIEGIITADPAVMSWADEHAIKSIPLDGDWQASVQNVSFDYLISVDNPAIVPGSILRLPRRLAINFHDAPLPKYAGVHATNWAILNGETRHGITWHVMVNEVDAGDILKQAIFPIRADETALTLNSTCFEKSIEAFAELVDDLIAGKEKRVSQDLDDRSYFPRWKRPTAAATINWNESAEEIERLLRSLDFGSFQNPLTLPKLYLGDQLIIVREAELLAPAPQFTPGTILAVEDQTIRVACGTGSIQLAGFYMLDGTPREISAILAHAGLAVGDVLPQLEAGSAAAVTETHETLARHEAYWRDRLARLEPLEINYVLPAEPAEDAALISRSFTTPHSFLSAQDPVASSGDSVLAALAIYFGRISGSSHFDLDLHDGALQKIIEEEAAYFASHVPHHIEMQPLHNWEEMHAVLSEHLDKTRSHATYARDLIPREPGLRAAGSDQMRLPVSVERTAHTASAREISVHDLTVVIPDDGRHLIWRCRPQRFSPIVLEHMMGHFEILLQDIAGNPHKPISQLAILSPAEQEQLLVEFNDVDTNQEMPPFLHEIFEAESARQPQKIAALMANDDLSTPFDPATMPPDSFLTYEQLNIKANQLARVLRRHDVGPDVIVGICLERSLESVTAMLAVLKAGGAFLVLDPHLPEDRLQFMAKDAGVVTLITLSCWQPRLARIPRPLILLDEAVSLNKEERSNLNLQLSAHDLAYLVYTSGSTGLPKGVMIEHAGMNVRIAWNRKTGLTNEHDRLIHSSPLSFDGAYGDLFNSITVGLTLIIVPQELERNISAMAAIIQKYGLTFVNMVPSFLGYLLDQPQIRDCPDLRVILVGGEALPVTLRDRVLQTLDVTLLNFYGPSEATVSIIANQCRLGIPQDFEPIGHPIANAQAFVLDDNLQLLPVGVPGELYIGGHCVGRGYLNRPELTAEKFLNNPFNDYASGRLYKTGDLARIWPDGSIEFLGRKDDQVKIRGYRVELGEIEARIKAWPGVKTAVVIVREDRTTGKTLAGYIVPAAGQTIDTIQLQQHLKQKLPSYMVPTALQTIAELPLGPHGKLDRHALPAPDSARSHLSTAYVALDGPVEEMLAGLWQEILGVEMVGRHDSFLELGGHSLLAIQVTTRLLQKFGIELRLDKIFEYPTVAALSPHIEALLLA